MTKDIITKDNNEYQQWFQHLCEEIDRQRLTIRSIQQSKTKI